MKKQSMLFPEPPLTVLTELTLKEAEKAAEQIKTAVAPYCDKIAIAGSIRRRNHCT